MPWLTANGIELEYDERGEGPPMLMIMGIGAQMIMWPEGLLDRLAQRGFRVIRFDNRDVGRSTWLDHLGVPPPGPTLARSLLGQPVQAPYTLWDLADDAAGLLRGLGIEDAHVVGVSMGGMVAQCLAIRHPRSLRSLTSMMSTTGQRRVSIGRPRALMALMGRSPRGRDEVVEYFVRFSHAVAGSRFPIDEAEIRDLAGRLYDRAYHPAGFLRHWSAILATGDRTALLRQLRIPSLVLHGEEDPLLPLAGGQATARAIPGARLQVVKGMGHSLPAGAWPELVDAIAAHAWAVEEKRAMS